MLYTVNKHKSVNQIYTSIRIKNNLNFLFLDMTGSSLEI